MDEDEKCLILKIIFCMLDSLFEMGDITFFCMLDIHLHINVLISHSFSPLFDRNRRGKNITTNRIASD